MYIKVNAHVGFNTEAVSYWVYEPPLATPQVLGSITPRVPGPDPVMTIHFMSGEFVELHADDADRVRAYFSVPSSQITAL